VEDGHARDGGGHTKPSDASADAQDATKPRADGALADASADVSDATKPPVDGALTDGSADARHLDARRADGGGHCVYPTDGIGADGSTALPQPTPGTCQGNTAVTCDPATHALQGTACGASEACAVFTVTEHPWTTPPPGRTYAWAGCIPAGATPCAFSWSSFGPDSYPPGQWVTSYAGNCQGNDALGCTMAPVITDPSYVSEGAGTTTGYVSVTTCASDEACAVDPQDSSYAGCYASPLVSCSPVANSACSGDLLLSCDGYAYQTIVDCAAQGQVCREDCPIGLPNANAECRDPLSPSATQCAPSTFTAVCADSTDLEDCNPYTFAPGPDGDCFMNAGQCVCYATVHSCGDIGCGVDSTDCECASVLSDGGTTPQCVLATSTLCDPSTTPDSCKGSVAQTCIGYIVPTDCASLGEICKVEGGHAGCAASPATTCSGSASPTCTGDTLSGCCPPSGQFPINLENATTPCAPGFTVRFSCAAFSPTTTCTTTPGFGGGCISSE
jgi:hypothetical protein